MEGRTPDLEISKCTGQTGSVDHTDSGNRVELSTVSHYNMVDIVIHTLINIETFPHSGAFNLMTTSRPFSTLNGTDHSIPCH